MTGGSFGTRGGLSRKDQRKSYGASVDRHSDRCDHCPALASSLRVVVDEGPDTTAEEEILNIISFFVRFKSRMGGRRALKICRIQEWVGPTESPQ
jgi:hypothetical protein